MEIKATLIAIALTLFMVTPAMAQEPEPGGFLDRIFGMTDREQIRSDAVVDAANAQADAARVTAEEQAKAQIAVANAALEAQKEMAKAEGEAAKEIARIQNDNTLSMKEQERMIAEAKALRDTSVAESKNAALTEIARLESAAQVDISAHSVDIAQLREDGKLALKKADKGLIWNGAMALIVVILGLAITLVVARLMNKTVDQAFPAPPQITKMPYPMLPDNGAQDQMILVSRKQLEAMTHEG